MGFLKFLRWWFKPTGKKDASEEKTKERKGGRCFTSIEDIRTGPESLRKKAQSVGIIALCQERESEATFFVDGLIAADDIKSIESAREALKRILDSPFRNNVYKLPELPNGTIEISRAWLTHFRGYVFLGGDRDIVSGMYASGIKECLRCLQIEAVVM